MLMYAQQIVNMLTEALARKHRDGIARETQQNGPQGCVAYIWEIEKANAEACDTNETYRCVILVKPDLRCACTQEL